MPCSLPLTAPLSSSAGVSLCADVVSCDYAMRMFIDGIEVAAAGGPGDAKETTVPRKERLMISFPIDHEVEIIVYAANFYHREGAWIPEVRVGLAQNVAMQLKADLVPTLITAGVLFTAFFYHLGLFILNRKRMAALLFSVSCLMLLLRINAIPPMLFPTYNWHVTFRVEYLSNYGASAFLALFLHALYPKLLNRWVVRAFLALSGLGALTVIAFEPVFFSRLLIVQGSATALMMLYVLLSMIVALRRRNAQLLLAFLGIAVVCACGILDMLHSLSIYWAPIDAFTPIGMVFFVVAYSLVVAMDYARTEHENELLATMNRFKTEFLSNISHELKTPLTVVSNYAQLTRMHSEDEATRDDYVRDKMLLVTSEAERMALMVGQL